MENPQRYIFIDGEPIPVTEEVYRAYMRPIWRVRKQRERVKRCRIGGVRCTGKCSQCPYKRTGGALSIERMQGVGHDTVDTTYDLEDVVEGRMLLEALFEQLEELDSDGQVLCQLLLDGESERQIAKRLGISQVAVNKRKQRVFGLLREGLRDWL